MADAFNLDAYRANGLPPLLWRVTHAGSQYRDDPATTDQVASDSTRTISNKPILRRVAKDHFEWACRNPSCFLSAFRCQQHARRWARGRRGYGEVYIHVIDTAKIPDNIYVFDATSLSDKLEINYRYAANEFIFLHRIPRKCLIGRHALSALREHGACDIVTEG